MQTRALGRVLLIFLRTFAFGVGVTGEVSVIQKRRTSCFCQSDTSGESRLLRATLRPGIAPRRLPTHGELAPVTVATPRADILQTPNIHCDFASEFSLREFTLHTRTQSRLLLGREVFGTDILSDDKFLENPFGEWTPNPLDRRQSDDDSLCIRENNTRDTDHKNEGEESITLVAAYASDFCRRCDAPSSACHCAE